MIPALDQNHNEHGAKARIVGGGVGYDYVKLKFTSEFYVEVY